MADDFRGKPRYLSLVELLLQYQADVHALDIYGVPS
jgi:hypothetical protein